MATRAQLEQALINADKAGANDDAKALASALVNNQFDDAQANPYTKSAPLQDTKPSNAVDFSQGNSAIEQPSSGIMDVANEAMSAVNRGVTSVADFFTTDQINAIMQLAGSDKRVPRITDALSPATQGGQMQPGLARDVVRTGGEMVGPGMAVGGALRAATAALPAVSAGESAMMGAIRSLGSSTPVVDAAASAGSGAGQEIGRYMGGDTGAAIGALVGGVAGGLSPQLAKDTVQGGKQLIAKSMQAISKIGSPVPIIDAQTGLPAPMFEKALQKYGMDYGSVIDDVSNLPTLVNAKNVDEIAKGIAKQKLLSGSADKAMARIRLENNQIVPDKIGENAIKQGWKEGDVAAFKGATQKTRQNMERMLKIQRAVMSDSSKDMRPSDVTGQAVLKRFNFIRNKADALRKQLEQVAEGYTDTIDGKNLIGRQPASLKGQEINVREIENAVLSGLNKIKVDISEEVRNNTTLLSGLLKRKESFIGSDISKDKTSQKFIRDAIDLLSEPGHDAYRAHRLKRQLDALIDYNKSSPFGLTEKGRSFAKSIRTALNNAIREVNPRYGEINDDLSRSIEAMNSLADALPGKVDIFAENADAAIGQDLRKLLSNYASRQELRNSLQSIDDTAKSLGLQDDTDIRRLVLFSNAMDERLGTVAKTSLKGELQSAKDIPMTKRDLMIKAADAGIRKLRGVNDTEALNAMQKLLRRGK